MMMRIRKGDRVKVMTGKDKGRDGVVLRVLAGGERLIVENLNEVKRHLKPDPGAKQPGGRIEQAAPLHVSNVALYNPATGKGERVGIKRLADGRKVRYFKSNGEVIDT